jgi:excisionase family DNA binding protein
MTVKDAAQRIGISASKLYQLVAGRRIAFYRVGGKIIFAEADVEAYLAACRVGAVTPGITAPRPRVVLKHIKLKRA